MIRSTVVPRASRLLPLLFALAACSQLQQGVPPQDAAADAPDDRADATPMGPCVVWVDESGNGRDGPLTAFAGTPTSGFAGAGTPGDPTALVFDGADDRVDLEGDPMHSAEALTVAAWVRLRSNSGRQTVFSIRSTRDVMDDYAGYVLYMESGSWRSIYFTGYFTGTIDWEHHTPAPARVDAWTHLATTLSLADGFARFYVDGVMVSERRATRRIRYNDAASPHVGGETGGDHLRGSVGMVRAWSRGLSRAEVADEFRRTASDFGVVAAAPVGSVPEADALRYGSACRR